MSKSSTVVVLLAGVAVCAGAAAQGTTAYVNGRWYDGSAFVERDAFVSAGRFVDSPRAEPSQTIDLAGGYVVPAFGEAHHHTVLCTPERIAQFVRSGVLYAAIMVARSSTRECQARLHGDGSVEIVSALSAFTATDAHPSQIGRRFLRPDEIDGEWVHFITTLFGEEVTDDTAAAANVALLHSAGVTLLIGSDAGEFTSVDEAVVLVESGIMPAAEVVRSLTMTTPRFFFVGRRIGELTPRGRSDVRRARRRSSCQHPGAAVGTLGHAAWALDPCERGALSE